MIYDYKGKKPEIDESCFIADGAYIVGNAKLGRNVSVWFGAVVRADNDGIEIGDDCNIQDNASVHSDPGFPVKLGEKVTIGHNAVIHGCTIEDKVVVGMGATVLNGAVIGTGAIIGAGALVKEGTEIPPYSLAVGVPARIVRTDDYSQLENDIENAEEYLRHSKEMKNKKPIE